MKIYTKTGDSGDTSLFGGKRIAKSSVRIESYGTVDELNAQLGIIRALKLHQEIDRILEQLQSQLFKLGADLATPLDLKKTKVERIGQEDIEYLENTIDRIESALDPLQSFIIPGGSIISAHLHATRAVCRRAERLVDALGRKEKIGQLPLIFLNRLSDLFFILARYANKIDGIDEKKWNITDGQ